jgi:phage repressor protein C with HTH and peptisase S24 domain
MKTFRDWFYNDVLPSVEGGRGWKKDLADKAGMPLNSLVRIVNGETKSPSIDNVGAIIDACGGVEALIRRTGPNSPVEEVRGSGLPKIPVYGTAGAGDPQEFWSMEPEREIEVLPQYARKGMVAVRVDGDSMEPTIQKGAYVGVAPLDGPLTEGRIYLVNVAPFGRLVKRVRAGQGGCIELISDNPKYPPTVVPLEQYESVVVGRVAWVWQEL